MPKTPKPSFADYPAFTGGCVPQADDTQSLVQRTRRGDDTGKVAPKREMPLILGEPPEGWRQTCLGEVAKIPAGYTYFAQLVGHDMGSSMALDHVPHVLKFRDNSKNLQGNDSFVRYNLIENPLTLETIYGPGPRFLTHLYDPKTWLFRLKRYAVISDVQKIPVAQSTYGDEYWLRFLYDDRNRDTLMLHQIATAVMQFHNIVAREILANDDRRAHDKKIAAAYAAARWYVVGIWHNIIRNDLMPQFVHPEVMQAPIADLSSEHVIDEVTLLHGLFRAFHALPLSSYTLFGGNRQNLKSLMKNGYAPSLAEEEGWDFTWATLLKGKDGVAYEGSRTGMSASVAPELSRSDNSVATLDFNTAKETDPMRLGSDGIIEAINAMKNDEWRRNIKPKALAAVFAAKYLDQAALVTEKNLENSQLSQALLVEAQLHGHNGGFGPFGSALLRRSLETGLNAVNRDEAVPEGLKGLDLPNPSTLLELITLVRR